MDYLYVDHSLTMDYQSIGINGHSLKRLGNLDQQMSIMKTKQF